MQSGDSAAYLDYPMDYPMEYYSGIGGGELLNPGFSDTNFRLVFYGAVTNPTVYINGHGYQVNCTVGENEYVTVDSVTKKITHVANDGTETNVFKLRNRDSYIFEKIPSGISAVAWDGTFDFDVILLEERSEPKWT